MASLGKLISDLNSDSFENTILEWLKYFLTIDSMAILAYLNDRPPQVLFKHATLPQVHEDLETTYASAAYLLDPFYSLHVDRSAPGLYALSKVVPDQFKRTEYYTAYYQRTLVIDELVYVVFPSANVSVHISIGRVAPLGRRFSTRDITTAEYLAPVICALGTQHWASLKTVDEKGEVTLSEALRERLENERNIALTKRQAEVALLVLRGHSSVSIGLRLGISEQTVKVFRKQFYRKCGISSQAELFSMMIPILSKIVEV
ncbi:helix-turn-helix transcriptional regulator [Hoeflea sp. Naph1]|uniref:helix-turn-helix transcriptional regulator n=1 Tax=Hoeflea sp. Naph1 TaxID=3388653 RepID=UPI00399023BB